MVLVRLIPLNKYAKDRAKMYGPNFYLRKVEDDKFLVESTYGVHLQGTEPWAGWFTPDEADYEVVK